MTKNLGESLLRYKKDQKYLVFDTETCNLNLASLNNKPWQLSYSLYSGNKLIAEHDKFPWWEDLKVGKVAAAVTRFDYNVYNKKAKSAKDVFQEFWSYLNNPEYLIVGQNVIGFDQFIVNIYAQNLGFKSDYTWMRRVLDTKCLERAICWGYTKIPQSENERLLFQYQMHFRKAKGIKASLGAMCKKYDIDYNTDVAHDALYDIDRTFQVFQKQIWSIEV